MCFGCLWVLKGGERWGRKLGSADGGQRDQQRGPPPASQSGPRIKRAGAYVASGWQPGRGGPAADAATRAGRRPREPPRIARRRRDCARSAPTAPTPAPPAPAFRRCGCSSPGGERGWEGGRGAGGGRRRRQRPKPPPHQGAPRPSLPAPPRQGRGGEQCAVACGGRWRRERSPGGPGGKRKVFVSSRGRRRFALPPPNERKTAGRGREPAPSPFGRPCTRSPSSRERRASSTPCVSGVLTQRKNAPRRTKPAGRRGARVRCGLGRDGSGERTNCVYRGNRWQGQGGGTGPPRGGGRGPDSRTQRCPPPSSLLSRPRTPAPPPALTPCGLNLVARRDQP